MSERRWLKIKHKVWPGEGGQPFKPTEEQRIQVKALAAFGIPQDYMRRVIINPRTHKPIDLKTLEKYFREELDSGLDEANAQVFNTLYSMATSGNVPSATYFWLKTRAGLRETDRMEVGGVPEAEGGVPVHVSTSIHYTDEERAARLASMFSNAAARKKLGLTRHERTAGPAQLDDEEG